MYKFDLSTIIIFFSSKLRQGLEQSQTEILYKSPFTVAWTIGNGDLMNEVCNPLWIPRA